MKLSPMILQGLWEFKSPFLQLPFVTDDHLRLFMTKKRHIKNLQQFAQLPPDESRHVLKHLSDDEYANVLRVLGRMPLIDFSIRCEGMCVGVFGFLCRFLDIYSLCVRLQLSTMRTRTSSRPAPLLR